MADNIELAPIDNIEVVKKDHKTRKNKAQKKHKIEKPENLPPKKSTKSKINSTKTKKSHTKTKKSHTKSEKKIEIDVSQVQISQPNFISRLFSCCKPKLNTIKDEVVDEKIDKIVELEDEENVKIDKIVEIADVKNVKNVKIDEVTDDKNIKIDENDEITKDTDEKIAKITIDFRKIDTLDLLLFRGADTISTVICNVQQIGEIVSGRAIRDIKNDTEQINDDMWSHVGIAIHGKYIPREFGTKIDKMYVLESVASGLFGDGLVDVNGDSRVSVQIRELDAVVKTYLKPKAAKMAVCKLINNPTLRRIGVKWSDWRNEVDIFNANLEKCLRLYVGMKYDANVSHLLGSVFSRCCVKAKKDMDVFCSEFVAAVYVMLQILEVEPSEICPTDFVTDKRITEKFTEPIEIVAK
ncbi:MAG TPA: hypothetical protein VI821_00195 [Candidatus Paceibacterota bacterium]